MIQESKLVNWKNKDEVIKFCESNKLYLDNYRSITNLDSQLHIINIKLAYCNALIDKCHYSECLESLTHLSIMINKLKNNPRIKNSSIYKDYLFLEGIVFGYLKRYEESQTNFKELVKIDPKNDLFKDWFVSNKKKIIARKSNIFGYIGCGVILLNSILLVISPMNYNEYTDVIGLVTMVLGFSFPYIVTSLNVLKQKIN